MTEDIKKVTRTGLILAVTLILQGLRLVIPIPPQVSMFVVGSLVNACLIVAVLLIGRRAGLVVAGCTPVFAWLEGMLPFFPFVFPVGLGNCFYVWTAWRWQRYGLPACCGGALGKAAVRHMLLFAMSWPQIVTGIIGAVLGMEVSRLLGHQPE